MIDDAIDTTKVQMLRSAKGCDMLCVDNYLYHYDDRGYNSYRWVCNKRKDKLLPCRSRLITTAIDNDESRHQIKKIVGDHSHGRCSAAEIAKAYERKRLANLAGEPCTLINKSQKRRDRRIEEFEETMRQEEGGDEADDCEDGDADTAEADEGDESYVVEEEEEEKYVEEVLEDWVGFAETECEVPTTSKPIVTKRSKPIYFANGEVYMLKGANERQLACLDGHLYYLDGKSQSGMIYRWQCVRQRLDCTTRLYTDGTANNNHKFKQLLVEHTHEPYTAVKLTKVISQNKLCLVQDTDPLPLDQHSTAAQVFLSEPEVKRLAFRPRMSDVDHTYELVEDPMSAMVDKEQSTYVPQKKFTFLPSAKGNQVLCMDNYIYHFDSRSNSNGHSYWTCILRRNKEYKCTGRITTKMTSGGARIVKVSGTHAHPDNVKDIRRRLYKSVIAKKAHDTQLKPSEILKSSMDELGADFKRVVASSKESIERRIGRLRNKNKRQEEQNFIAQVVNIDDDDERQSMSSLSSDLESDAEQNDSTQLPESLATMREQIAYDGSANAFELKLMPKSEMFAMAPASVDVDDIIEELPMDEEYVDQSMDCSANEEFFDALPARDTLAINPRKRKAADIVDPDMDIEKVSTLRSAKGGELLCVDGYIYHVKSSQTARTYWACIKCKDRKFKCPSRVATTNMADGLRVVKVSNHHSHPVYEADIKRRLCNELTRVGSKSVMRSKLLLDMPLRDLSEDYAQLVAESKGAAVRRASRLYPKRRNSNDKEDGLLKLQQDDADMIDVVQCEEEYITDSGMKLYAVSDGPPSLAVRMTLKALNIPCELINVDYAAAEHLTEKYAKLNPQKEIPVLDDDGFYLPESIAIMQYLCDKYAAQSSLYPAEAKARAVVNHRLCFNMGFYYAAISMHAMAPIFFDYQRTEMSLKKVTNALSVFETFLQRAGTKYAAAEHLTIADFALVAATACLEAIKFDLSPYPLLLQWYETFKQENPDLWAVAEGGMREIEEFEKNPPDLSHMQHPFHPTRNSKA